MNIPLDDQNAWLHQYTRIFDAGAGGFLFNALRADLQDAWMRAINGWQTAPERYTAIQAQWQAALSEFQTSVAARQAQPWTAIADLQALHKQLGKCLRIMINEAPGLSATDRRLLIFGVRHLLHALTPEHWPQLNQEVLRTAAISNGASYAQGLQNFYQDLANSVIGIEVKTADKDDFVIGESLAVTPGEVVFENRLFQLIQYYPGTQEVSNIPLLIVPPWINKYYVLDLTPTDSFVQWAIRQGHTVFMMSWVNPDTSHCDVGLDDYLVHGCLAAATAVEEITGESQVNVAGYCIGGFLATCAAAYQAVGERNNIASLTLLTTMLDYSESGDIGVFLSERILAALTEHLRTEGVLDGRFLRQAFAMLREDRMFWPYVVNNYLLGKPPEPNPVLFWNRDATNLPRRMLSEFLRDMYRGNALCNKHGYELAGRVIDLDQIAVPVYALACRNDHIIPWRSAYQSVSMLTGDVSFVLAESGHVMGVVNPPNKRQSGYWSTEGEQDRTDADAWLASAGHHAGSWWPHWQNWIARRQTGRIPARFPGTNGNPTIERAPGRYVKK